MPVDSAATVELSDDCGGSAVGTGIDLAGGTATFYWTAPAGDSSCKLAATATRDGLSDAEYVGVAIASGAG